MIHRYSLEQFRKALDAVLDNTRMNKVYDRVLFDYGYYGSGVEIKRLKRGLFYYNHICSLGNNRFQEGNEYKFRLKNSEINAIINQLKSTSFT